MGDIVKFPYFYLFFMSQNFLETLSQHRIIGKSIGAVVVIGTLGSVLFGYADASIFENPAVSMIIGGAVGLLFG